MVHIFFQVVVFVSRAIRTTGCWFPIQFCGLCLCSVHKCAWTVSKSLRDVVYGSAICGWTINSAHSRIPRVESNMLRDSNNTVSFTSFQLEHHTASDAIVSATLIPMISLALRFTS